MRTRLTPEVMLSGYRAGIFPMADEFGRMRWYSPDPRCVLEFDRLKLSRSLRQTWRQRRFEIRVDTAFRDVLHHCADRPEGTWISRELAEVYQQLHGLGLAHSVEAWRDGGLAGGLYGVALGGAFIGESMFYRVRDASKIALVALMERLEARGFVLVDCQWLTPHLASLGAIEIPRRTYLERLGRALDLPCRFAD